MSTNIFNKAKSIAVIFALMAVVFSINSCSESTLTTTDFLLGTWTVQSYNSSSTVFTSQQWDYNDSDCGEDDDCSLTVTEMETFSGGAVSGEGERDYDAGQFCFQGQQDSDFEYSGTITTWTIEIRDDGTYIVSITYTAICTAEDFNDNDVDITYSGSYTSSVKSWYLDDANADNKVITFMEFPLVDFGNNQEDICNLVSQNGNSAVNGELDYSFRIESGSENSLTLVGGCEKTKTESSSTDYIFEMGLDEIDCTEDYSRTITTTESWTVQMSK